MTYVSTNKLDASTNNTEVPWHVAVYSGVGVADGHFAYICGGTIVSNRLVVSAAHCFWNIADQRFHALHHFRVATGRYYSDYNETEPLPGQKLRVRSILSRGFQAASGYYEADIAVLVLADTIEMHEYIVPICMHPNAWSMLDHDPRGRVAGWGGTASETLSRTLQSIALPIVTRQKCIDSMPPTFTKNITPDSFCAGHMNQSESACPGDSGGGIVVQRDYSDNPAHLFLGVVRMGNYLSAGKCDIHKYTVFTNVSHYYTWIMELIDKYDEEGIIPAGYNSGLIEPRLNKE